MEQQSPAEKNLEKPVQQYIDEQGRQYIEAPYEPIYYTENGSSLVYGHDYQSLSQDIYHEGIVEHEEYLQVESLPSTSAAPPPRTNKNRLIKDVGISYPNSTVLITNQSLKGENATLVAKAGKRPMRKPDEEKKPDLLVNEGGSALNRNLPGMTNVFKVLRESALKKTEESLKMEELDEEEEEELAKTEQVPVGHEDPDLAEQTPPPMERLGDDGREFPSDMFDQWPLYSNRPIDFNEACELLIGIREIDEDKVCKTTPMQFKHEGTFLIDLRRVRDVHNDDNGGWEVPSGKNRFYKETAEGNTIRADDGRGRLKEWAKDYTFKIMLKRYENRVTRGADDGRGQFQKKIYTGLRETARLNVAIVTYSWSNGRPWNFVPPVPMSGKLRKVNWEKKSFENVEMTNMPQNTSCYFDGFNIFSHEIVNFDEAAAIMLGATVVDSNKICSSVPLGYRQKGTFVIDMKRMGHCYLELRRDDNGLWTKPSGFSRFYKFVLNGDAVRVDKAGKLPPGTDYDVKISCKRYDHTQVEKKFVRKIYTAKGKATESFPGSPDFAVIVYFWKGPAIAFEPSFKQSLVRSDEKEYARYQQIADEEHDFVETSGAPAIEVEEEETNLEPPQLKRARYSNENPENLVDLKMTLIRREMENQDRFAAVLDRADALLSRMEQRFGMEEPVVYAQNVQQWDHVGEQIIEEEVLHDY